MQNQLLPEAEGYARTNVRRRIWRRFVRVMACIVVFCTTYALILPAITMEKIQCEKEEHVHGESCYEKVAPEAAALALSCTYESLGVHVHTADCYDADQNILCGQADYVAHIHGASCVDASGNIVCQLPERVGHVHTEACFIQGDLLCELAETEGHTHEAACYEALLVCELPEEEPHNHAEDCYELIPVLICGLEENSAEPTEETQESVLELICTEPVAQSHVHSESCYVVVEEGEEPLTCGLPEDENHTHSDVCYGVWTLICGKEEHTHDLRCKSNPEADVESETAWMASFANAELTGRWALDMVAIAQTQVGYAESTRNYMVLDDNVTTKGYTRYGAWYGDPYGDWCAMFASFCLHYAGVEDVPVESNCPKWIQALTDLGMYYSADAFAPRPGDLVFFDWDEDGLSDHVGIVEKLTADKEGKNTLHTIEGNSGDRVVAHEYAMDDETILGYFALPEQPAEEETNPTEPVEDVTEPVMEKVFIRTLSYTGADYEVTLRFDELAEIPAGAELTVRELTGEEYQDYLQRTYEAIAAESNQVLVQFGDEPGTTVAESESNSALFGSISFARFFDLTIMLDGQEIQPKDTVEVSIRYDSSVELGDGEKTAVHFAHDGTVEVLEAEKRDTEMMTMRLSNDIQPMGTSTQNSETNRQEAETDEPEETEGETFVFYQDSFSVSGTVELGELWSFEDGMEYPIEVSVENWVSAYAVRKTLTVYANYTDHKEGKTITIKVPNGFQIVDYTAIEGVGTQELSGVTKVAIDDIYKDAITNSILTPYYPQEDSIVGVTVLDSNPENILKAWETQGMVGYTTKQSAVEAELIRTYGGIISYQIHANADTVRVVVTLRINQELLSHTANNEVMDPIEIQVHSNDEKQPQTKTTEITVMATGVPIADIRRSTGAGGSEVYYVSAESYEMNENNEEVPTGKSELIPVSGTFANRVAEYTGEGSYFDEAVFVLEYPWGVFLEPDSAFLSIFGLQNIDDLVPNQVNEVVPGHLSIEWKENDNGGGYIKWIAEKGFLEHSGNQPSVGASFTANTNSEVGVHISEATSENDVVYYGAGDAIDFTLKLEKFKRNEKERSTQTVVNFQRILTPPGNQKDIRITNHDYVRRDITADFRTDDYSYGLGGFNVQSMRSFADNTFFFENHNGLKITALNLMGKNPRNVIVVTDLDEVVYYPTFVNANEAEYSKETQYQGTLLTMDHLREVHPDMKGQYIKYCIFTVDFEQITYTATHVFGGFTYMGQFHDGDGDGNREGDVTLRMLQDYKTYEDLEIKIEFFREDETNKKFKRGNVIEYPENLSNNLKVNTYVNPLLTNEDPQEKPVLVVSTDHTQIGWTNTGVGASTAKVVEIELVEGKEVETTRDAYYAGDTLRFYTDIHSGYKYITNDLRFVTQDMLINPVLVISLPPGITLQTNTVMAQSAAGSFGKDTQIRMDPVLVKKTEPDEGSGATPGADNDKYADWTTYICSVDMTLSAEEEARLGLTGLSEEEKQQKLMLALVAEERFLTSADGRWDDITKARLMIKATFDVKIETTFEQQDLRMEDIIMWDVRNTAYVDDPMEENEAHNPNPNPNKPQNGYYGDAIDSQWNTIPVKTDENNFLGYGNQYGVVVAKETFLVKPLVGLNAELGIRSVYEQNEHMLQEGYITYKGENDPIATVIPNKYADVMLSYHSTSDTYFFQNSSIYVPIPKVGVDYAKYFENIELVDPVQNEITKTFQFTMSLTGPVALQSVLTPEQEENFNEYTTEWITYYAVMTQQSAGKTYTIGSNPKPRGTEDSDTWEPVAAVISENDYIGVNWLTEEQVNDANAWADVVMMKFVAQDNIAPDERGIAIMRLKVADVPPAELGDIPKPPEDIWSRIGERNYWRGYYKPITDEDLLTGNWEYTSVVAATPAMETLIGQIFVDANMNGKFDSDESPYKAGIYTAELRSETGNISQIQMSVEKGTGEFALQDANGKPLYLSAGTYTLRVLRNSDQHFSLANTEWNSSIGQESPDGEWHNNVNRYGEFTFTVTNEPRSEVLVHRVGVAVQTYTTFDILGQKTLLGAPLRAGSFKFVLTPVDGELFEEMIAFNDEKGAFEFEDIRFTTPGDYVFHVWEDSSKAMEHVIYDSHVAVVTVTVTEDAETGILKPTATYSNYGAEYPDDAKNEEKAAFTNFMGYELPSTGGTGTYLYTMGGMLLLAAAVLLYIHILKRRKEERPSF